MPKLLLKKIDAEAEVNEVTIFRRFQNKKNLVEKTKEYHFQILIDKLREIFDFNDDDEIEGYLQSNFIGLLNLSDRDFAVFKIAMEEVRNIPDKKQLISRITDTIIDKLEEFFNSQIEKGKIRQIDSRVLALMCFSITFQSVILWRVYEDNTNIDADRYAKSFLDMLYNGIKVYIQ